MISKHGIWGYHALSGTMFALMIADSEFSLANNRINGIFCSFDGGDSWQICYESDITPTGGFYASPHSMAYPYDAHDKVYFGTAAEAHNLTYNFYYAIPETTTAIDRIFNPYNNPWNQPYTTEREHEENITLPSYHFVMQ